MFSGAHVIIYSKDTDQDRAFLRDHRGIGASASGIGAPPHWH